MLAWFSFFSILLFSLTGLQAVTKEVVQKLPAQTIVEGSNQFAFDFYEAVKEKRGNFCFSPYSLCEGLSLVSLGAAGATSNDLQNAIGFPVNFLPLITPLHDFLLMQSNKKNGFLLMANEIWLSKNVKIDPLFKKNFEQAFNRTIHFFSLPQAVQEINHYTSKETKGAISQIIERGDIAPDANFLLTSCATIKGSWLNAFSARETSQALFKIDAKREALTQMMRLKEFLPFFEGKEWDLLALPYLFDEEAGPQYQLLILLPKEMRKLREIEDRLKLGDFKSALEGFKRTSIDLFLPRFYAESRYSLGETVKSLPLSLPFSEKANFSEISKEDKIYLNKALHRALIRVEEGYGGTPGRQNRESRPNEEEVKALQVKINRPFLFFVWEKVSGAIVMMGRIERP